MPANSKLESLYKSFSATDRILVAFSGGVDSTFLLYVLKMFSGAQVSAVTVKTPYIPQWEVDEAKQFCISMNISHEILEMPMPTSILMNPPDRCYKCKSVLFGKIKEYAAGKDFNIIADGSNADDKNDYRPGMAALRELDVRSPLLETGISKEEIRKYLRDYGLDIWDKPAYACLLTRLPHDQRISSRDLQLIEESELFLHGIGFKGARVRLHRNTARLEIDPGLFNKILENKIREKIIKQFKARGIEFVSLDLEGYRTGSMNPKNKRKQ
ncbi:MAG: ATP-dependent sacrificial sulfur transferase LarE [Bacteroidales bacterium]|nr:ATP-dependent sacrificial sulfur transferase LarE [Bacteroidales bacterium]